MNDFSFERLTRMEVEVRELKASFQEHKVETKEKFDELNRKLDDLLALRNKGAGILWLLGGILGTGFTSAIVTMFHYWK